MSPFANRNSNKEKSYTQKRQIYPLPVMSSEFLQVHTSGQESRNIKQNFKLLYYGASFHTNKKIPRNRRVSEPHTSQCEVYVCLDRSDAIEPLLAYVKCIYHATFILARSVAESPGAIFPPCSKPTHAHHVYR